ncbi:MAG: hypothetical protein EZS28_044771 [Streblomastix strix]|uniref:Uncharacterized protein n=1 Tax=Streblomastix strix TaxID=222440 RepID=A0A5J4TPA1_9EUKA|nr:MAG: hypothetical protein EZS28_044771 [Streblomastix strix]
MIPPEKPDIVYLLAEPTENDVFAYKKFNVRIVNMQNAAVGDREPQNSISQINNARFEKLDIQNICFNVENEEAIVNIIREQRIVNFPTQVFRSQSSNFPYSGFTEQSGAMQSIMTFSNIKSLFMTFAMPQYPTWFYPILFYDFDLIIDQRHVVPQPYNALTQTVNGLMFDCFVDQDVVSAPSDLYHSLTFENLNCSDKGDFYGRGDVNVFITTTLFVGAKASKTLYPNKYMLAWKLATDDSFMRGYNSSKHGARTNIQVILHGNLTKAILDNTDTNKEQNQNDFNQFIGTRAYPDPCKASITPMMHYLCDSFVRIVFDDSSMPQVLNIDVIGELGGSTVNAG